MDESNARPSPPRAGPGEPEVGAALEWASSPYQAEIRARDLRAMEVEGFVSVLYAGLTFDGDPDTASARRGLGTTEGGDHPPEFYAAQRFVDRQRRREGYNTLTPEFLESVAKVYRDNVKRAPTQAVARTFGVKSRMASVYVDRARQAGLLPRTSQGKAKA